jgi:hypothetical protein
MARIENGRLSHAFLSRKISGPSQWAGLQIPSKAEGKEGSLAQNQPIQNHEAGAQ